MLFSIFLQLNSDFIMFDQYTLIGRVIKIYLCQWSHTCYHFYIYIREHILGLYFSCSLAPAESKLCEVILFHVVQLLVGL